VLGPALTQLLRQLENIPAHQRAREQTNLFDELALLAADLRSPSKDERYAISQIDFSSRLSFDELNPLAVTRPDPTIGLGRCCCCGQRLST
jgi:hypothetical protein